MLHDKIIRLMEAFGYRSNMNGVCKGISYAGVPAILFRNIGRFNARLNLISGYDLALLSELPENKPDLALASKVYLSDNGDYIVRAPNGTILQGKLDDKINLNDLSHRLNDQKLKCTILNFISKRGHTLVNRQEINMIFNQVARVKQKVKEKKCLSNEEKLLIEIPALLESIELHFQPHYYPDLFDKDLTFPSTGNPSNTFPLLNGDTDSEQAGVVGEFSGIYSQAELVILLQEIKNSYTKEINQTNPFVLVLNSSSHNITIGYDPEKKTWILIDANQLPAQKIINEADVVDKVFFGFRTKNFAAFSTTICVKKQKSNELSTWIDDLKVKNQWKKLHTPNSEKAKSANARNITWLFIAARQGYVDIVKLLLVNGAKIDKVSSCGSTPLHFAASEGQSEVVKLLLANGANVDKAEDFGVSPLYVAAEKGYLDVVKLLLANGANVDKAEDLLGVSPLHVAAEKGHLDVVKLLLAKGANVDKAQNNSFTPLCIAIQKGSLEVVKLLLSNGANKKTGYHSSVDSLRSFTEKYKNDVVKQRAEQLISVKTNKNNSIELDITPYEIAWLLGHTKIMQILQPKFIKNYSPNTRFFSNSSNDTNTLNRDILYETDKQENTEFSLDI